MPAIIFLFVVFNVAGTHRVQLPGNYILANSSKPLGSLRWLEEEKPTEDVASGRSNAVALSFFLYTLTNTGAGAKRFSRAPKLYRSGRAHNFQAWHPVASISSSSFQATHDDDDATPIIESCKAVLASFKLPLEIAQRVEDFIKELLTYNERTNIYSKSAYAKLPFHIADSITLALHIRDTIVAKKGVLDLGSGSGLPSVIISCVNPELPVYAVESKSRKTRFLVRTAKNIGLEKYTPLTQNVKELVREWTFDVDVVTAKAFKPLNEVGPIGQRCILECAQLLVPISESQVEEFSLNAEQVVRQGNFLYFSDELLVSQSVNSRKIVTVESARASGL